MVDAGNTEELASALSGICPDGLGFAWADKPCEPIPDIDLQQTSHWSTGRATEYRAGRWCARVALDKAGVKGEHALLPSEAGLPSWPMGSIGSISHSRGLCAAVAGCIRSFSLLGLDLERTDRISPAAADRVVHPLESDFFGNDLYRASLLFSLKEAFYKAQYPRWKLSAGFRDLALRVDPENGCAQVAKMEQVFSEGFPEGISEAFQMRFKCFGPFVVSLCWIEC